MKNYVISLTTAQVRREHIHQEFDKQNIAFEFFDAITPDMIAATCQKLGINLIQNQRLSAGEKACFLSHVCLWQKMLDDNTDYMAVFEDDIYLGENAGLFFTNNDWLKNNMLTFVKTETFLQERKLSSKPIQLMANRQAYHLQEYHLGTAGYIINQTVASHLLDFIKNLTDEKIMAIDQLMFDIFPKYYKNIHIYQLYPAICIQEFILYPEQNNMPSDIKSMREQHLRNKPKRNISIKIKGELSNLYRKSFGKLSRKKIIFR